MQTSDYFTNCGWIYVLAHENFLVGTHRYSKLCLHYIPPPVHSKKRAVHTLHRAGRFKAEIVYTSHPQHPTVTPHPGGHTAI